MSKNCRAPWTKDDFCQLAEGHEGFHSIILGGWTTTWSTNPLKCGATRAGVACELIFAHEGEHKGGEDDPPA